MEAIATRAGKSDALTTGCALGEITWSALHGLATLERSQRPRPGHNQQRLALLVRQLTEAATAVPSASQ